VNLPERNLCDQNWLPRVTRENVAQIANGNKQQVSFPLKDLVFTHLAMLKKTFKISTSPSTSKNIFQVLKISHF
jgi:hypothetical protein